MMKNRKNRVLAMLLAAVLLLSCLTGCAGEKTENAPLQQAKEKMLAEWFSLLEANEQVYASVFQVLDHTEAFTRDNSWDSLLKARAAASAALMALRRTEVPVTTLTEEEIALLADAGIEISALQREFEATEISLGAMDDTLSLLYYALEEDVFLTASATDAIPAMAAFYREYFTLEYRYLSRFTNYLLLQAEAGELWTGWQEQLPCLASCADAWYEDTESVELATGELLDEMAALQTRMGSFLGVSEFTLEIVQEAVETGNMEALRREINLISGVPGYFPLPQWLPDTLTLYMVTEKETQEKQLVLSGDQLDSVPSACYISCGAIAREEVEAYGAYLEQWGIETYGTWNDAGDTWQLLANSGSSAMLVEWTEEETLIYLTEPVGCLIPELYLYAMTAE